MILIILAIQDWNIRQSGCHPDNQDDLNNQNY
jgi:hypothetical protein